MVDKRIFWGLLLLAPFLVCFFSLNYIVSYDESFQLQAAVQLHKGLGYRSIWWQLQFPYFQLNEYSYLKQWPIGYSAVIAGLMFFNIKIMAAAKIVNAVFLVIGVISWDWYHIKKLNAGPIARNVILIFLVLSGMQMLSNPTNLIVWAIFPFLLQQLSSTVNAEKRNEWYAAFAGIIISICMLLRYQTYAFMGVPVLYFFFTLQFSFLKRIKLIAVCMVLPIITCAAIWYTNHIHSTSSAFNIPKAFSFAFDVRWFSEGMINVLTHPFSFNGFAPGVFVRQILLPLMQHDLGNILITLFGFAGIFFLVTFLKKRTFQPEERSAYKLYTLFFICNYLFLTLLSMFLFAQNAYWVPIMEGRYFSFLFPLAVMQIVKLFSINFSAFRLKFSFVNTRYFPPVLLLIGFLFSIYFTLKYTEQTKANKLLQEEVNNAIKSNGIQPSNSILFVQEGLQTFFYPYDEYSVYPISNDSRDILFSESRYFEKSTTVVIISNKTISLNFNKPVRGTKTIDELATTLSMRKHEGSLINFYIKTVQKGENL